MVKCKSSWNYFWKLIQYSSTTPWDKSFPFRSFSHLPNLNYVRLKINTYATPAMPSLGLEMVPGLSAFRPTRSPFTWPHRFWRRGSSSELGGPERSLAFFGEKEDSAFSRSFSGREWFSGPIVHSPRFVMFPPLGGWVLLSVWASESPVTFPGVNPALKGTGVEGALFLAADADDACRPIIRVNTVFPKTDCSCSPMEMQF